MATYNPALIDSKETFIAAVSSFVTLDETARVFLRERLIVEKFAKNALVQRIGKVDDSLCLVHSGLARSYCLSKEEKEISSWFFEPTQFIYCPHNFLSQTPVRESVDILTSAVLVSLSHKGLSELYHLYPPTTDLNLRITTHYASLYNEQLLVMRTLNGVHLLKWFYNNRPSLYSQLTAGKLASFLGMSAENLSRIQGMRRSTGGKN